MEPTPKSKHDPVPGWRKLLHLGEELLGFNSAVAQCKWLEKRLANNTGGVVKVWLLEPYYPLPGEPSGSLLNYSEMDETTQAVFHSKKINIQERSSPKESHTDVTIPIITDGKMLAIARIELSKTIFDTIKLDFLEDLTSHAAISMQIHRQEAIKNWRSEQLSLVRKVSSEISNYIYSADLFHQIASLIKKTFKYYHVGIYILNKQKDGIRLQASTLIPALKDIASQPEISIEKGIIGYVGKYGKEIIATDTSKESRYAPSKRLPDTKSEIALPIKVENQVLGVLDIQSDALNAFADQDLYFLQPLADNIGIAFRSASLYENLKKRADQINATLEVSRILNSIFEMDELLEEVTHVIHDRFAYPFVHLYLVEKQEKKIYFRSGSGARSRLYHDSQISYDISDLKGIIPYVSRTGITLLANDVLKEKLFRQVNISPVPTRSEMAVPLIFGEEILGVLDIQSDKIDAFDEDDKNLIESLAVSIAITIRNASLYRTEQWRRKVADSFHDVAALLTRNLDLSQLLDIVLVELEKNLPCQTSAIWLLEEPAGSQTLKSDNLHLAAVHGVSTQKLKEIRNAEVEMRQFLDSALIAKEPKIRKPEDPYGPLGKVNKYLPEYSSIAAPLTAGDEVLGLLILAHSKPGKYGIEASAITSTFASYAALAIQNARNLANAQVQAWTSTVLLQVADSTRDIASVDDLLNTTVRLAPLLVGVKRCAIFLWDKQKEILEKKASFGLDFDEDEFSFKPEESPAIEKVFREKSSYIIKDVQRELKIPNCCLDSPSGTVVLLPLIVRDEILGILLVGHESTGQPGAEISFDLQTLSILQGISSQISVALENIRLEENRQEEAYVTAVMLQVAQAAVSQNNLGDILDTIIHLMPILVGIDSGILFLWDPQKEEHQSIQAFSDSRLKESELLKMKYKNGEFPLLDWVIQNDKSKICLLPNELLEQDQWISVDCSPSNSDFDPNWKTGSNLLLAFPISLKNEVFGTLIARETNVRKEFHDRRLEILNGIAQQIAMAIQNDLLQKEIVTREKLQREVQVARQIQETFLPTTIPQPEGWDINVQWDTAREVGGDFYDVFPVENNRIGLVVADVSDKGLPAALYMTVTRTLIRAHLQSSDSPSKIFKFVNDHLQKESPNSLFVTAVFCMLDTVSGKLVYANAGHNLPLIYRSKDDSIEILPKGGIALGVVPDFNLQEYSIHLEPNDFLVLYTDGVTETFSPEGETYGEERLMAALKKYCNLHSRDLIDAIKNELAEFRKSGPIEDDLTIIVVHRTQILKD
jgi:sigma-B regulation protein RsbU (phosphoserine phosphatase)